MLREAGWIGFDLRGVLWRVLTTLHAVGTDACAGTSSVEIEAAGDAVLRNGNGVLASHTLLRNGRYDKVYIELLLTIFVIICRSGFISSNDIRESSSGSFANY